MIKIKTLKENEFFIIERSLIYGYVNLHYYDENKFDGKYRTINIKQIESIIHTLKILYYGCDSEIIVPFHPIMFDVEIQCNKQQISELMTTLIRLKNEIEGDSNVQ
jgi:hypothetical protein